MLLTRVASAFAFGRTGFEAFHRAIKKVLKSTKASQRVVAGLWRVFSEGKREQTNPYQMFCRLNEAQLEWHLICEFKEEPQKGHPE